MNTKALFLFMMGAMLFGGCVERDKKGNILDNPTSGSIQIAVDESLRPLLEAEVDTFQGTYTYAFIKAIYTSEANAMDLLLKDSVRLAVVTRKLTDSEMAVLKERKLFPDQVKVAKDGVAIIVNRENTDSVFQFSQLQAIIEGKVTQWKQINKASRLSDIEVVFDHPQSGIIRFVNDSIQRVEKLPPYFYAVDSNAAVIDYVSKKPNAIGLIGACWISDRDDATVNRFLNTIRVARIGKESKAVQPYQAYIEDRQYPLRRDVYMISREFRTGLGTGFIAFVAGDKGQRIVLKSGMVPATMPTRTVQIHGNR
jgi:phosphate transport system substrate-binding protein